MTRPHHTHPLDLDPYLYEADAEPAPGALASLANCTVIGIGGFITGQLLGWALNATGILAALGIG